MKKCLILIACVLGFSVSADGSPVLEWESLDGMSPAGGGSTWTESTTGMEFVWIKGGCFQMGSPVSEPDRGSDEQQHEVCVDGFYLGKYEVTQGEWQKVMGSNPSRFKNDVRYPVEQVSWHDAKTFADKLSTSSGKYRLPTEAEWEYAARAGTTTPFSFGRTISPNQANYDGNYIYNGGSKGSYRKKTTKVGSFPANHWGLHDMHGNVWEWCSDWYDADYYSSSPRNNPQGASSGSHRVVRGGSWYNNPAFVRSALRSWNGPGDRINYLGFRLAFVEGSR